MNYTKNYRLPQWVKEDRIMMDDFNAMNSSIESGLTKTAADAASAVSTANDAKQTANGAAAAALACSYVVGTYIGDGGTKSISLGFQPSFVIISGMGETTDVNSNNAYARFFGATAGTNAIQHRCAITSTGFTVYPRDGDHFFFPSLNEEGRVYDYIAFR